MALEKLKKKKNPEQNQKKPQKYILKCPFVCHNESYFRSFFSEVALRNPSINTKNIWIRNDVKYLWIKTVIEIS